MQEERRSNNQNRRHGDRRIGNDRRGSGERRIHDERRVKNDRRDKTHDEFDPNNDEDND